MTEKAQTRESLRLANDYVAPQTARQARICDIWRDAFDLDQVGMDDDFFDLGGDSMIATTIAVAVSDALGIDFRPGLVMEYPTIRQIAALDASSDSMNLPANVVLTRASGGRPPLFVVHGRNGITFLSRGFMSGLHPDQPVYTFQIRGFDGRDEPLDRVEDIAEDYLASMLEICPDGPWFIAAYCSGSWIAVEMARRMLERGLRPDRIVLLDPGLLHARLNDEYLVRRGAVSGADIPLLSPVAAKLGLAARDATRRTKLFFRTGHWVSGQDRASFDVPAVEAFFIERQRRRLGINLGRKKRAASTGDAEHMTYEADSAQPAELDEIYRSDSAARASARLQLAFRTYLPEVLDFPVDMIISRQLAGRLADPKHPINMVLPKRRVTVSKENHRETISAGGPFNATVIQSIIDDAQARRADVSASVERQPSAVSAGVAQTRG